MQLGVEEMRKLAGMLMCSTLLIAFSCGEVGDPQAETKRRARQMAGAPEMQTFLEGAKSKLVSALGGNVIAESAVKVAAGLKGGKSAADYEGRPVAWIGTPMDYGAEGDQIIMQSASESEIVTVVVKLDASSKISLDDWSKAHSIVVGGILETAGASRLSVKDGFISAMWLQTGTDRAEGKEYPEAMKAGIARLKP